MEIKRNKSSSKFSPKSPTNPHHKYEIGEMLGQGQFGKVYKAHLQDHQTSFNEEKILAAKVIPLGKLKKNSKLKELLTNEVEILSSLKHENIIKFEELFVWEEKVYMIYEYCEGDLEEMLPINENQALRIFRKIIKACSFAEKHNILHRDIKPANILFKNGEPKVADWGFSRFLKEDFTANSFVGSPAYMAPEILKGLEYTIKADVWSFGVMVYESIFNEMPWQARNIKELLTKLQNPVSFPREINPILKSIIKLCLEVDSEKRITFRKLEKLIFIMSKGVRTEFEENPEESRKSEELPEKDIKKCSFYLEFAKKSQKFENREVNGLCLDFIIANLERMKMKNFEKREELFLSPCKSNRRLSITKREMRSPKTSSKTTKRESNQFASETYCLLEKEIFLIKKIRNQMNPTTDESKVSHKIIIKQIIKKLLQTIDISEKSLLSKPNRKQLIESSCILETIMFDELQDREKNMKIGDRIEAMMEMGLGELVRSVNNKILFINQRFCRT